MGKNETEEQAEQEKKKRLTLRNLWRFALLVVGVVAVVQELQKPPKKRTWHGRVGDFVPYDLRMPTADRIQATYWDPDGPILPGKVFGVGWAVNFGAVKKLITG